MASRQEEKERRRREREEAERKVQRSGAGRKRMAYVLSAVLAVAIVAIVILAVAAGGDDNDAGGSNAPNLGVTNLTEAAKAAGCELKEHREEGRGHTSDPVQYKTNPPNSGAHDPVASEDGIYEPGNPPDLEQSVHALEHGRINFQYRPGTEQLRIDQLEGLVSEEVKGSGGYHSLLFANQTRMPYAIAATAWKQSITCSRITDETFDALRAFRLAHIDKGPEFIP
jgi:hypothetical protein